MKVQFKFKDRTGAAGRKRVFSTLGSHGATAVRRLFPTERDGELSNIYIIDVPNEAAGRRVLTALNGAKEVEFAEWEVRRKLIKHGRPA